MLSADAEVRGEQATGRPQGGRSGGQGSLGAWLGPAQTGGMLPSQRLSRGAEPHPAAGRGLQTGPPGSRQPRAQHREWTEEGGARAKEGPAH